MLWLMYGILVAFGVAGIWIAHRQSQARIREYKEMLAIQARLPQREPMHPWLTEPVPEPSPYILKEWEPLGIPWPTENSASEPSSESAPPSTPTHLSTSSELKISGLTGVWLPQSQSTNPLPAAMPAAEMPTESATAKVSGVTATKRGKRESKL